MRQSRSRRTSTEAQSFNRGLVFGADPHGNLYSSDEDDTDSEEESASDDDDSDTDDSEHDSEEGYSTSDSDASTVNLYWPPLAHA